MKKTYFIAISLLSAAVVIGAMLFFGLRGQGNDIKQHIDKNIIIDTNALLLDIKKIRHTSAQKNSGKRIEGGSIIKAGDNVIIQKGGDLIHLDLKTYVLTPLNIVPPENNFEKMKHILSQRITEPASMINLFHHRYNSILTIKRQKTITLLISYNYRNIKNLCQSLRLARIDFPAEQSPLDWTAQADDWKVIFETSPCISLKKHSISDHQSGGRIIPADKQSHVLLTIGDFNCLLRRCGARLLQKAGSDYGRIVEINIDNGQKTNISIGHRNPQGIARGKDGKIWSTEHGPRGGDELNLIQKGKNYGWPFETYGTEYERRYWNRKLIKKGVRRGVRYQKPVFAFVPSIGISNLTVIDDFAPEWDGDLLAASLIGQTLYRMRIVDGRVVFAEPIRLGVRIRYIYNHGNKTLVALGDQKFIFIIKPGADSFKKGKNEIDRIALAAWNQCIVCHSTGATSTSAAPTLRGVFKRRIGQSDFRHYSPGMKSSRQSWTRKNLAAFLTDPDAMFEETSMPDPGIDDPRVIKAIINHLKKLKP